MENINCTTLQDLPEEMVYEIFSYLPLSEVVRLHTECLLFHNTVVRFVVGGVRKLPNRIMCEIQNVTRQMQSSCGSADSGMLDFCIVLLNLRYMLSDADLLIATVLHYIDNEYAQNLLLEPLGQILQEFYSYLKTLRPTVRNFIFPNYSHRRKEEFDNFLKTFDSNLRVRIEKVSGIVVPVEVIIADLLHCSVSANMQTNFLRSYEDEKYSLNMFFQLKYIGPEVCLVTDLHNMSLNDDVKQNEVIIYLRSQIRYENRAFLLKYVGELIDLIVRSGPNVDLDDVFEKLKNTYSQITLSPFKPISCFVSPATSNNNMYNIIYYRANNFDVSKTGITIDFKMLADKKYLPLDYNYKTTQQLYLSKNERYIMKDISDTKLGTLDYLYEVPKIDHGLSDTWSPSNEYCDIVISVHYEDTGLYGSSVFTKDEIVFSKTNSGITLKHKVLTYLL